MTRTRSPRRGDWVRAVEDVRDGQVVEGLLIVSDVDQWGHVRVEVEAHDGRIYDVIVDSVEVLRSTDAASRRVPGRRVADLAEAEREGLLLPCWPTRWLRMPATCWTGTR